MCSSAAESIWFRADAELVMRLRTIIIPKGQKKGCQILYYYYYNNNRQSDRTASVSVDHSSKQTAQELLLVHIDDIILRMTVLCVRESYRG